MTRLLFWDNLVFDGVLSLNGVSVWFVCLFCGWPSIFHKSVLTCLHLPNWAEYDVLTVCPCGNADSCKVGPEHELLCSHMNYVIKERIHWLIFVEIVLGSFSPQVIMTSIGDRREWPTIGGKKSFEDWPREISGPIASDFLTCVLRSLSTSFCYIHGWVLHTKCSFCSHFHSVSPKAPPRWCRKIKIRLLKS